MEVNESSYTPGGSTIAVSDCQVCGSFLNPDHQNRDVELSINSYIKCLLKKTNQFSKDANLPQETNNNIPVISRSRTSFPDIIAEVKNIASYYNVRAREIDDSAELLVGNVRKQQQDLKEILRRTKTEALLMMKDFIKTVEMKPEEDQELQDLIHQEVETSYETEETQDTGKDEPDNHLRPEAVRTIDVKLSGEGLVAIQDVIVMTTGGRKVIVVSDYINRCVKCFYMDEMEADKLKFPQSPFYLTHVSDSTAATSFGTVKQIAIFQVLPRLKVERMIETMIEYSGLQRLSDTTFAASRACAFKNGIIDVIDISGTVLRSFGSETVSAPYFIEIDGCGRIIVSDSSRRSIFCFTGRGDVRFMYRPTDERMLSCPRGLKYHNDHIYVVDEDSNKVIQLTEQGDFVKDILTSDDALNVPRAIDVDGDGVLYVSVQERFIKVFQLP